MKLGGKMRKITNRSLLFSCIIVLLAVILIAVQGISKSFAAAIVASASLNDANNITFIGHLGGQQTTSYPGSRLDTIALQSDYLYIAEGTQMTVIDVSNPATPTLVAALQFLDTVTAITIHDQYVYLTAGSDGLKIIDITNPISPTIVGEYSTAGYANDIAVSGSRAYLITDFDLYVLNITNSTQVSLFRFCGGKGGVTVDPLYTDYVFIGRYIVNVWSCNRVGSTILGFTDVKIKGYYAYATDWDGVYVINVSNPAAPIVITSYDLGMAAGISISGNRAYVSSNYDSYGIHVFDITSPYVLTELGTIPIYGLGTIFVSGEYAYTASQETGLYIVDITNPTEMIEVGYYTNLSHQATRITKSGDYIYVSDGSGGFCIADVSIPSFPRTKSCYFSEYHNNLWNDSYIIGDYAYAINLRDGWGPQFHILDITDPLSPSEIRKFPYRLTRSANGIDVADYMTNRIALIADGPDGFKTIDVTNPYSPTLLGELSSTGFANEVTVHVDEEVSQIAYLANGVSGLTLIDITTPITPTQISSISLSGEAVDVAVTRRNSQNWALVAAGVGGLQIIDVTDPYSPTLLGSYNISGYVSSVDTDGNYAFITDGTYNSVQVINITDPDFLYEAGHYRITTHTQVAEDITVAGNYIYVADGYNGVVILEFTGEPPTANDQSVSTAEDSALSITLTASDPESSPLTYSIISVPEHGALSGAAPNLTYTPVLDYYGTDAFTFKANDGQLDSNTATVTISVQPQVSIVIDPTTNKVLVGRFFTVSILVTTGIHPVDGAQAYLNFDPTKLQVKQVTGNSSLLPLVLQNQYDNTLGSLDYAASTLSDFPCGTFILAQIQFQAIAVTSETGLTFHFGLPRNTDVTNSGVSVLNGRINGSIEILETQKMFLPIIIGSTNSFP